MIKNRSGEINISSVSLKNISNQLNYYNALHDAFKAINVNITDSLRIKFLNFYNATRISEYCGNVSLIFILKKKFPKRCI